VFEIACFEGDDIWQLSDERLFQLVRDDVVDKLGFIREEEIIDYQVVREAHAYPVYVLGYQSHRRRVMDFLGAMCNLTMIGRNGVFRYNNMDHSIETGIKAAENYLGAQHDLEAINIDRDYNEVKRRGQGVVQ
jgi:protoporphyrinogen oxidase